MGLFSRYKDLHDYKILEVINVKKTPIGINGASGAKCRVLYEDENVQVLSCEKERFQNKSHYLLRRDKNNKGKIVFLGETLDLVCYCNGKAFYVFPHAIPMHNHTMTMIDCLTGERKEIDFLEKEEVLGFDPKLCRDVIKDISSSDNKISIFVIRNKIDDPKYSTNSLNEDLSYKIEVIYQNGLFDIKPVTLESIVKKGPWPKPKFQLPPGPYTAADMDMLYHQYGKEAVDEALLLKEIYG